MECSLKARAKSLKFAIWDCHKTPTAEISAEINGFCQIPEEVVEEILLRLPAESLKNCRRVCKYWFKLINDPSFVNKHLVCVTSNNSKLSKTIFLKWIRQELSEEDIFDSYNSRHYHVNDPSKLSLSLLTIGEDDGKSDHIPCVIEQLHLPPIPKEGQKGFPTNFCALHCNGIIHLFDRYKHGRAVLLNPTLREFKLLQEPSFDKFFGCGFGYDPKAQVHKYVKIFGNNLYENAIALVRTLGTNSWRKIKIDVEGNFFSLYAKGVYCNGVYYWQGMSKIGNMILSFDMFEEKFQSIPFPNDNLQRLIRFSALDLWKESVVLFISTDHSWYKTSFEMWVMVDGLSGVKGSAHWIKHLKIGPLSNINYPLTFWKDDELLFETNDGRLVSYNLYTQTLRKVPLPGAVYPGYTYAALCLKSIISV